MPDCAIRFMVVAAIAEAALADVGYKIGKPSIQLLAIDVVEPEYLHAG